MKNIFKNKKILIMGLGLHGGGVGVAKFFYKQGANILITDLKTKQQLKESLDKLKGLKIKYSLGGHKEADFIWPDLIIKNPDVPLTSPYLKIAEQKNIPIETDINLFFKLSKPLHIFTIGVTGTKGKSTTASLIYHLLKFQKKNNKIYLAGNIGISPLELLNKIKKGDKVILELSSFELERLTQSPNIAVITNIMPDHLNRYGNMKDYIEAKKAIFKFQKKKDILVLNYDDPIVRRFAEEATSKVVFYSVKNIPKTINLNTFQLSGEHNLSNLLAAIEVAKIMKISPKIIEKSLKKFKGVAHRQEFIREVKGVKYFNDTAATMPEATISAINVFSQNFPDSDIILICGGQDKGLKYNELAKTIKKCIQTVIMLPGTASEKIKKHLLGFTNLYEVSSMQEAVKKASELSKPKDIVVLSPGAASFNLFKNEFDRGKQFIKAVENLFKNDKRTL